MPPRAKNPWSAESVETSPQCPRCSKPIRSFECTRQKPHLDCTEKPIVARPHIHWRCGSCGFKWIEYADLTSLAVPSCPLCEVDLTAELDKVPEAAARTSFLLRCPGCQELLQARPSSAGLTLHQFPTGEVENPSFERRLETEAEQAG